MNFSEPDAKSEMTSTLTSWVDVSLEKRTTFAAVSPLLSSFNATVLSWQQVNAPYSVTHRSSRHLRLSRCSFWSSRRINCCVTAYAHPFPAKLAQCKNVSSRESDASSKEGEEGRKGRQVLGSDIRDVIKSGSTFHSYLQASVWNSQGNCFESRWGVMLVLKKLRKFKNIKI